MDDNFRSCFQDKTKNFRHRLVSQDETWVQHFKTESKIQSKLWKHSAPLPSKNFKLAALVGCIYLGFWSYSEEDSWDASWKRENINGLYYASELIELKEAIKLKWRGKLRAGVHLLQDNMPIQTAQVAVDEASYCGFELQQHSTFLTDLAPSDFFLFPNLKSYLYSCHFGKNDEVTCAVEEFLQCSSSVRPSTLMSSGYLLENREKLFCFSDFWVRLWNFWMTLIHAYSGF